MSKVQEVLAEKKSAKKMTDSVPGLPQAPMLRFEIRFPRIATMLAAVVIIPALIALGFFVGRRYESKVNNPADRLTRTGTPLNPGPWGEMDYQRFYIECPDEYLDLRAYQDTRREWVFKGYSLAALTQLLERAGVAQNNKDAIIKSSRASGVDAVVTPSRDVVFSLTPTQRRDLYTVLSQGEENSSQVEAFSFPAESFDEHFAGGGLPKATVALVKSLCYPHGKLLRFADLPFVLDTLPNYEDKKRLLKTVSRQPTMLLRLRIRPESDINALVNYWGRAGYGRDIRPLFDALTRVPEGTKLNLAMVLPPWPTARLYTFPFPSYKQPENCHWTSFNFFKDPPDGSFSDLKNVKAKLDTDYYPVFSDPRYGDLVFLTRPNGDIVHSAVFLADDIVYTKNGGHYTAPWMLAKVSDLVENYSTFTEEGQSLKVLYFRNKNY